MVVAAAVVTTRDASPLVVEVAAAGSVEPTWVAGAPVWVVNEGGGVLVLSAVNPHPWHGMDELLGWCAPVNGFQAWWDLSRFDDQGRWLSGPAPRDLDRYEVVDRSGGVAAIGNLMVAEGRTPVPNEAAAPMGDAAAPAANWCEGDGSEGPDAVYHGMAGSERELFDGRMVTERGRAPRFCAAEPPDSDCSSDALRVIGVDPNSDDTSVIVGRFLARRRGQELHDLILLPPQPR
jgi:hypothetical protein